MGEMAQEAQWRGLFSERRKVERSECMKIGGEGIE